MGNGAFLSLADARKEVFAYIEEYYNRVRRHSSLGYLSPAQFEVELARRWQSEDHLSSK
ncbi:Integrase core domain-containing protein [Catalinimonas alkaloidigena]|uniref:Integrase core domain-containing protein n=1 Tax=Catalinimonas alkaloidigena TaxID=1075417 RepID=A0A1G9W176_9BACT|nr:Integrase core domain-containing protein [Catalinimonas alkaloidigena]